MSTFVLINQKATNLGKERELLEVFDLLFNKSE